MDWTRPVALSEFFVPLNDALAFDEYRDCITARDLRWLVYEPTVAKAQRANKTAIEETLKAVEGAT